jgi:opacity protein-like surface antigen
MKIEKRWRWILALTSLIFMSVGDYAEATDGHSMGQPHVGPYVSVFGGYRFSGSLTEVEGEDEASGQTATASDLKYDGNLLGGVKLGTWLNHYLGMQLEGWYSKLKSPNQDFTVHGPFGPVTGQVDGGGTDSYTGAFNIMLRLPAGVIEPYVGVGAAVLHLTDSDFDDVTPGFNALAGLQVHLTEHVLAFGEFKYSRFRLKGTEDGVTVSATYQPMAVVGGLSFEFGGHR